MDAQLSCEFMDHEKIVGLSDGALRVWLDALLWSLKPRNTKTRGVVPRVLLCDYICKRRYAPEVIEGFAAELVAANGSGTHESGLWEPVEGGWRVHDWAEYYARSLEVEQLEAGVMTRAEAGRVGGRVSGQRRRRKAPDDSSGQLGIPPRSKPEANEANSEANSEASVKQTEANRSSFVSPLSLPPTPPLPITQDLNLNRESEGPVRLKRRETEPAAHSEPEKKAERPKAEPPSGVHRLLRESQSANPVARCEASCAKASAAATALWEVYSDERRKVSRGNAFKGPMRFDWKQIEVFEMLVSIGFTAERVRAVVRGAATEDYAMDRALPVSLLFSTEDQRVKYEAFARKASAGSERPERKVFARPEPKPEECVSGDEMQKVLGTLGIVKGRGNNAVRVQKGPGSGLSDGELNELRNRGREGLAALGSGADEGSGEGVANG